MSRLIFQIFSLTFILNESCTSSKPAITQKSEKENYSNPSDSLFFSMERTPCYGKCPVYKVNIYRSGHASFEAIRNVADKNGIYKTTFTKEEMKMISDKAEEIKYFEMEIEYDSPVTDLPSVITSLNFNDKKKTIRDRHKGPPELRQFEKLAEEIINGKGWEKIGEGNKN